ncbi:HNH endonuclease, partial [Gordonia sp. DT30]|uniref:HNH endonuclease n=1 Tax=Gordonia sp. DT30 TaxID=3416546 RepID=UPI003CEB3CDD
CKPTGGVLLTIPADTPKLSALEFMGSVTPATAKTLGCDASITVVITDMDQVPLNVGREKRLFTSAQRKALLIRDKCCVKCGAPAARTQAHHLAHWADGGATDLDNGCLLCTNCHDDVHHHGWEVIMGFDRHPWLIPPATIDPHRRPQPAYHRRTLRLDNVAA